MAKPTASDVNRLYYGDNLEVLQNSIADESVDLVYLDPPFNSNRNYNVIFGKHVTVSTDDAAQIQAFGDTWTWTPTTDEQYADLITGGGLPNKVADALAAMRTLLTENDAMAYLVNMAPRLVELHRVLKSTGSLYLHCDPTMSHYLKVLLDAIFGPQNYRSEIIWKRYGAHNDSKGYGAVHDVILFYSKGKDLTFNKQHMVYDEAYVAERFRYQDPDGRRFAEQNLSSPNPRPNLTYPFTAKNGITYPPPPNGWKFLPERMQELDDLGRLHYPAKPTGRLRMKNYLDEAKGVPVQDLWTDIPAIGGSAPERLGYPTQKPVALMERIVASSTNEGDVVLDPFCGCGTTVDAAQKLGRRWIGIDVTYIAIDLITKRLQDRYAETIDGTFEVAGIPRDKAAALALFSKSPFDFERWAVSLINAQPNQKQVGDKGIDGVARFPLGDPNVKGGGIGRILVSVKGGKNVGPQFVRDLLGTVETQKAEMGVLILLSDATKGIVDAVNHAGTYKHPGNGQTFSKVQVITVSDLLLGKRPNLPSTVNPYMKATKAKAESSQMSLEL